VITGSIMGYSIYVQEGTKTMPARPFLGLSSQDYQDIDELMSDWLEGLIV
jgi:phage virion morphogeneis protein